MTESWAVLDVGSNTIRLLVARAHNGAVEVIRDESDFVRLGKDVDRTGELQKDRMDDGVEAIRRLASDAHTLGAEDVIGIATSAVRDAKNGRAFVQRVADETGVGIEIISGEREAKLTYLGATSGLGLRDEVVVMDLGGGSAEIIAAGPDGVRWAASKPLGSGRLSERFLHHDPAAAEEIDALSTAVAQTLRALPAASPGVVVLTGGTASNMAYLAGRPGPLDRLSLVDVHAVVELVTSQTAAEITERHGIRLERSQVLPAGVIVIEVVAQFYGVPEVVVTRSGIREGAILEVASRSNPT